MTPFYLDTSALIKRYVREAGSLWIQQLFVEPDKTLFVTSRLTAPEMYSAFARRLREGTVSASDYTTSIQAFDEDAGTLYRLLELTPQVVRSARQLLENHPLRANDAVQLASALLANTILTESGADTVCFLSADIRLLNVARTAGLSCDNPADYL